MYLIGLTGKRQVGKSTAMRHLLSKHGFVKAHPFAGGKQMCKIYFMRIGCSEDEASRMIDGDLRDQPCAKLPGSAKPRYFMEQLGYFMGHTLGAEWTLGVEIDRTIRLLERKEAAEELRLAVESVVYEPHIIRQLGGKLIRLVRDNHEGVAGVRTDAAQQRIQVDYTIHNDGTVQELHDNLDNALTHLFTGISA